MAASNDMFPGEELGESSPDSVLAPHGFGTQSHAKAQRKKNMMAALDAVPEANLPPQSAPAWDIVSAFAALQSTMEPDPSPAPRQYDFVMPERRLSSNNSGVADFFVWTADGFLCSKQLSGSDIRILEAAVGAAPGSFCKLYFDPKPVAKLEKRPRGFKSTEHLEVLRQSNPCFSSLAPDLTRPSCAEYSYDPLTRFAAMKAGRVPRGVKSTEHLEILRTSNPDYSSLAPDATRPNHTEHSYEPLKRFAAMSVKLPRGFKSTEHLEVLRQSNPCFSSLAPDVTRPNCAEYSYDPLKRFAAMAWAEREPRGAKSAAHLEILRTSNPCYSSLAPDLTRPNCAEYSYEPLSRFAAVGGKVPRGFKSIAHLETLRTSNPDYGSLYPSERTNCAEVSYDPLKRFAALVEKRPRGFKSVEHLEILRTSDPCYGSLAPSDRPGVAEHSYAPMARFRSQSARVPRGAKTTEHLRVLRRSNPTFSSLAPDLTKPGRAEYSYDPLKRFAAMAWAEREPRGAKSAAHLEILRQSNPCYSSLAPDLTRPNCAEYSYEPTRRFLALQTGHLPRGFKSSEHLEVLRTSNPCYGSLAPSDRPNRAEVSFDPLKRFAAMAWAAHEPRGAKSAAHLEILRTSDPTYGTLAPSRATARRPQTVKSLDDVGSLARVKSVDGLDGWQCLDRVPASAASQEARHPEHEVAVDVIEWPEEESDEEESDDALPELPWAQQRRRQPRASSTSFDSDGASEARTMQRDWNEPRASNDTIASFMDDSSDIHASGEWPPFSPGRVAGFAAAKLPAGKPPMAAQKPPPASDKDKPPASHAFWGTSAMH